MTEPKPKPERNKEGKFLPGNQASIRHGAYSLAKTGKLPLIKGRKAIARRVREFRQGIEGAVPDMSPQRQVLLDKAAMLEGVLQIMFADLRRHGIWRADKMRRGLFVLQPALSESVISMINAQRLLLQALGLDQRRGDEVLDLGKYIEAKEAEKKAESAGQGEGEGQ
jgi:hypothetical protein